MDAEKTGKLICQLRNNKNLTQKELAEKLNVTDKAVSKWERGDGCPDVEMLPRLAEVFGRPMNVQTLESIKSHEMLPNLFVELGRFKAQNVSLEEGKILILNKKYKSWDDNDPVDVVVGNNIVHTGVACVTSNGFYAVRVLEDLIEAPVVYDEEDYLSFVVGSAYLPDEDLCKLQKDSVVELSQEFGSMVQIFRGDVHVASGEVCIADGKFAIRVVEVSKSFL